MIKALVLAVLAFFSSLVIYLYFYLGAYKPVLISSEMRGPLRLMYKTHLGAYHEIGPTIRAVEDWATNANLPCAQTFGEYLDNPENVDQDRLRSRGGCVLGATPNETPPEFQFEERPAQSYLVAHFEGSPAISPFTVYPKVKKYLLEHGLKSRASVIEIYTVNGTKVTTDYLFLID